jgi:hypothetical protein
MNWLRPAKERLAFYFVPALLVAVAARQFYLAHTQALSPWKGGGFGMFASVDAPQQRVVRAYLLTPDGEVPADLNEPARLPTLVARVRAMPGPRHLDELADALLGLRWTPDTTAVRRARAAARPRPGQPGAGATGRGAAPLPVSGVRVEVLRVQFDGATRSLSQARLVEFRRVRS